MEVRAAAPERLEKPDEAALTALSRALVQRYRVLPFGRELGRLDVAMRDPRDRALCKILSRASGLRIAPFLTSEIRLFFLLEWHFGIESGGRYASLGRSDEQKPKLPVLWLDDVVEAEAEPETERSFRPLAQGEELIDAASFAAIYQREYGSQARPVETPSVSERREEARSWLVVGDASTAALEAGLAQARERDGVVAHALALALHHARAVALFAVRGTAQGIAAAGEVERRDIRDVLVAPESGSLIAAALAGGVTACGAPAPGGVDARLARLLRGSVPAEVAYFPVRIAERVVNVLYADRGCEALDDAACTALAALGQRASQSYERIILEKKRRLC
jgi:hypothetical protein